MNPLHHPAPSKPCHWRTRADPFADVWNEIECWLKDEPHLGSTELLLKLEDAHPVTNGAKLGLLQLRWTKIDETF
ncbi:MULTISPECIES: hypothetical protein [Klebsiella/Raoultella group]|uniref:hypothetical protein n=1 Tax=Klebsiella/Raoultella group TaxID=2890311 RepID=UPI001914F1ED|nr:MULTISPECIES: hypothetical protein [Klebsiella/Raoultella group]MDC7944400.1 hypothetical protein [Raoultella ornithinolytica]QQM79402.1 hypothetical protein JII91_22090 [Klebsiella quasipneumoniae]